MTQSDLQPDLIERIVACLRAIYHQDEEPFCVVNWNDYYVQFHGRSEYDNLWFEAVSNYFLERYGVALTATQKEALDKLASTPVGEITRLNSR